MTSGENLRPDSLTPFTETAVHLLQLLTEDTLPVTHFPPEMALPGTTLEPLANQSVWDVEDVRDAEKATLALYKFALEPDLLRAVRYKINGDTNCVDVACLHDEIQTWLYNHYDIGIRYHPAKKTGHNYPMAFLGSPTEFISKSIFDSKKNWIGWHDLLNTRITPKQGDTVFVYPTPHSIKANLIDIKNKPKHPVKLTGGWRFQIDNLNYEIDHQGIVNITLEQAFDNSGPRALELHDRTPQVSVKLQLKELNHGFELIGYDDLKSSPVRKILDSQCGIDLAIYTFNQFLLHNSQAAYHLVFDLLGLRAECSAVSIEGMWDIPSQKPNTVIVSAIGFDGPNTHEDYGGRLSDPLFFTNILFREQLGKRGLINTNNPFVPLQVDNENVRFEDIDFRNYLSCIQQGSRLLLRSRFLSKSLKTSLLNHLNNEGFTQNITFPVFLGKILETVIPDSDRLTLIDNPIKKTKLQFFQTKHNRFYMIDLAGYKLAYWTYKNKDIDISNQHLSSLKASKTIDRLKSILSYPSSKKVTTTLLNYLSIRKQLDNVSLTYKETELLKTQIRNQEKVLFKQLVPAYLYNISHLD